MLLTSKGGRHLFFRRKTILVVSSKGSGEAAQSCQSLCCSYIQCWEVDEGSGEAAQSCQSLCCSHIQCWEVDEGSGEATQSCQSLCCSHIQCWEVDEGSGEAAQAKFGHLAPLGSPEQTV